ncbi:MAG: pectinesterase family protein [Bacteroidaceae bacterium]|nr:pectinesterase family protein [Bacteroidaceae bacterium]
MRSNNTHIEKNITKVSPLAYLRTLLTTLLLLCVVNAWGELHTNPAPVFTKNLTESATLPADDVIELWVTATGATSYQWYTNTTASNEGGTPIEGETRSVLNFVPQTVGTHYIYVVATNAGGSTASNVMTVTATAPEGAFTEFEISYAALPEGVEGVMPANVTLTEGENYKIPINRHLYKEGYSLTGWNDGSTIIAPNTEYTPTKNVTLTPVFTANTKNLSDRTETVNILWDFQRNNGAPTINAEGVGATGILVTQATLEGATIDVKLDYDATSGKLNNSSWGDWCQVNSGTILTFPSCKDAIVTAFVMNNLNTTTIGGIAPSMSGNNASVTITSSNETQQLVAGSDIQYIRTLTVALPKITAPTVDPTPFVFRNFAVNMNRSNGSTRFFPENSGTYYVSVAEDGTVSHSTTEVENYAAKFILPNYNGDQHGYQNMTAQVVVTPGDYDIIIGNCTSGGHYIITSADGLINTDISANAGGCYHQDPATYFTKKRITVTAATTLTIVNDGQHATYTPYFAVEKQEVPATRTFVDFKVNFRTNPYTVIEPSNHELPEGIVIDGTHHDGQHGYNTTQITVPVDGPVKFTFGSCNEGTHTAIIKDADDNTLATIQTNNGCDDKTGFTNFVSWTYNSKTPTTLTITTPQYIPFFYAEQCDLIPQCTVTYYGIDGAELGTQIVDGGSDLTEFAYGESDLSVPEGKKFRNWRLGSVTGKKFELGTPVATDISLYAYVSDIETVGTGKKFDLTQSNFYVEEHDVITSATGYSVNGSHGWDIKQATAINIAVEGPSKITLGQCQYARESVKYVIKKGEEEIGSADAMGTCAGDVEIDYTGTDAATLTISASGQAYLHYIQITPIVNEEFVFKTIDLDFTAGGNAEGVKNVLAGQSGADKDLYFAIADDGAISYTTDVNENANLVLKGKYHSTNYGICGSAQFSFKVTGPVTVTMGTTDASGTVTIKNSANEKVGELNINGNKYESDHNNVVSYTYKGGATTLTLTGGQYVPYIKVEEYTGPLVDDYTITFAKDEDVIGVVPSNITKDVNATMTIDSNNKLYKKGYTFVGWSNGTATYAPGDTYTFTKDETLTAVFRQNTLSIDDRNAALTISWDLSNKAGLSLGKDYYYVTQTEVTDGTTTETIDVAFKIANGSIKENNVWVKIPADTKFTLPSEPGAVITYQTYEQDGVTFSKEGKLTETTTDENSKYSYSYNVTGEGSTIDMTFTKDGYVKNLQVVLPAPEYPKTATWDFTGAVPKYGEDALKGSSLTANIGAPLVMEINNKGLRDNGSEIQVTIGTSFKIPVVSTNDEITVVNYSSDGNTYNAVYTIGTDADVDLQRKTYRPKSDEAKAGYVLMTVTGSGGGGAYIKSISVTQNKPATIDPVTDGIYDRVVSNLAELQEALTAADGTNRFKIFVKDGTYDFGTTINTVVKSNVSIIGESTDGVIIKNTPAGEGLGNSATLKLTGSNIDIENLTIQCTATYSDTEKAERGVTLWDQGDNNIFRNLKLLGRQDTYYSNGAEGKKSYFENCYIEGTVDYLCGSGNIWFEGCTFYNLERSSGDVIAAPSTYESETGYVFSNCTIDGAADQNGKYYYARGWQGSPALTQINTTLKIQPAAAKYTTDIADNCTDRFNEYTTENAPANITIENVIGGLGNNDATELITVEKPHINDGKLLWKSDTRAIAYYIYKDGEFVATVMPDGNVKQAKMRRTMADTYDMEYDIDDENAEWQVRAINAMGAVGPLSEPADDTPIISGYPKTATWDFKNASPSTITSVNIQGKTGTVASNLDGIELYVDATNGKLSYRSSGDAQFNNGTIIRVPIKSKQDEVTVTSYPNYHYYTVSGQQASEDVTTCNPSDIDVYNGYVEIKATGSAYLYSISVTQQDPTRTFKDFKINFRTDPYTVVEPSTGVLPAGVEVVKGTYHDAQHGYVGMEINVPVDGPVKFTIGSCQYGYDASGIKVKDSEGNEVGVVKPQKACDNNDTYDVNDVFYYNSFKPTTLTFSYGGYFPYFIAEKCNFIPTCTIEYYDTNGNKIGETETVDGNSPLVFTHTSAEVTIPTGHKFRSWRYGSASGRKANEGDLVVSDIKLYARTTPIEVASEYMHYDYDLRQQSFEVEEHDILMADGCGWHDGQHGWSFTNTSTLEIQVGGATTIRLGACVYSAEACKFELYNGSVKVGEAEARDAVDGKIYEIRYRGEATTLQLRATNTAYLHTLEIIGGPRLNFINNTDAQGVAPEPVYGNQTTQKFHIPNNYTLYKEGYTLMGWTDNETTYDLDRDYSFATDANLYPVFAENEIAITDADAAVTVRWVFDQSDANAAPKLNIATSGIYTKRAIVNDKPLDMLMTISGNVAGATVKKNTNLVVPKVPGMIVRKKVVDQDVVEENISGEGSTYTIAHASNDVTYEYIEVIYPVLPDVKCVNVIAGEKLIETEDPANAGTVTLSKSAYISTYNIGNRYLSDETVTITAQAKYGYYITGMKIGEEDLDMTVVTRNSASQTTKATATCTTTDGITNVTITYGRLDVYALHINSNVKDGGTITLTPHYDNFYKEDANGNITAYYTEGTPVEITAEPTVKYLIDHWSKNDEIVKVDDQTFTGNSITLTKATEEENVIIYYTLGYKGKVIFTQGDAQGASDSEWIAKGWGAPIVPDPIEDYGFTIPTCYTMYWQSHSITGWTDLSLADYNALSDGEKAAHFYALGSEHSFSSNGQVITLTPIYEEIKASFFNRTNAPVFMFDFRTDEMAQRINYGPNKKGYWATHIHVDALNGNETISQDRDSEIRFDTGAKGKIDNTFMGEWAAFGEGTTLWVPSCPYGVITLACYNKINMDLDDNGNPTGTTLEGKLPTLDPTASDPENNLYVYKWTTHSAENYVPLVIGDDYSYYKYIRCDLPAASYLDLAVVNEDDAKGSVVINDIEQGIMNADESIRFKSGSSVSVTATRNFGYELDYWDVNGVHVNHETAGGYTATTSTDGKSYTLSLILNDHTTIVPVFKVKPTYYITYNTGKQAEGVAPFPQWVEGGQKFEVAKNTSMYIEGQTLKYWVDENGNEYHFGENITAPDHDVLLYPVFEPNAFSLLDVTTPTEVKWIFGPKLGAPSIAFEGNAGILVAQLRKGEDFIDLKIDLDAKSQSGGKFNNIGREDEWCQINGGSLLVLPTSKDCDIELASYNDIKTTEICGNHEYTAGQTVHKTYTGIESTQTINFKNDGQYYSHVAVTYKPQTVDRPELASLSWDDTPLSSADLSTLKTNKNITIEVPPSYDENSTHDDYLAPMLTATVADPTKGSVEVTRASFGSPTATITLKSANGTITDVYTVNFTFAGNDTSTPTLEKIVFNGNDVENGSTVESPTNGRIALTFNHIMKETSALPTIRLADGTERPAKETLVAPQGKTLVFDFYGLPANATVTVTMPAGSFKDLYGVGYQEPVSLIIHAADHSTEIAHKPFDFVVGVDGTIDEAIDEANNASGSDRFYIFIPDGEYQLMGNDKTKPYINGGNPRIVDRYGNLRNELDGQEIDNGVTKVSRSNVSIIGQSREGTILFNEPEIEGISYTSTIYFPTGEKDGYLQDMTLRNNFPYLSSMAVQKEKGYGEQAARAVSLLDAGERNIYKNVTLDSWQDTYFSNSQGASDNRGYFEDCKLMGVVDFLCGDGDVWLERTDLILRNREGNNIAASRQPASQRWGYVFNNCRILAEEGATLVRDGDYTLGRPWGGSAAITYLYTKMSVNPRGAGWQGMSGDKPVIRFHEYKTMDENGNYISLGTRTLAGAAPGKGSDDPILSDADAKKYTVTNVLGGGEGYNPQDYTEQRPEVSNISIDDNILRWDKDEEALCYFVFKREDNGHYKYVANIVENELNLDEYGTGWYSVRSANQRGGLGPYSDPIEYIGLKHYDLELNNSINYTYENDAATYNGYTWSTICLPFRASAPQGSWQSDNTINDSEKIYVYAATEINATNKTITLKKVNHLEKNVGYVTFAKTNTESNKNVIYRFRGSSHEPELESILNGYAPDYVLSKDNSGTLIPSETPLNAANSNVNCYTLAYKDAFGIGFYRFNGVTLKPYRAWLDAEKVRFDDDSNGGSGSSSAHIRFVFDEGDSPWDLVTDIEPDIISVDQKDVKIYDIMGRRIRKEMMQVGNIYIINGKKILVK